MNHRDTKESVLIHTGLYSTTIFEMETWALANDQEYTDEEFQAQLKYNGCMDCGLRKESVGLFPTKERALEHLEMMYEDPFAKDRELYCAFIREKAMSCMMQPDDYIKEWTYVNGLLLDESLLRNFAEDENPFCGRPQEMIRFKKGDIVMIPDGYCGHWGIVWDPPVSPEVNDRIERESSNRGTKCSGMDWSDDQYTILTNVKDYIVSYEHILAHHVLPTWSVPEYVRKVLEEGLKQMP